ncbi:D-amino-acid oxidase [Talaromyces proteolyticus]|uniref:D-amino-acid oxidase n=1 Tax=Talaromyces proteolyticus TaxID=1131652 RepID=A0AAD4PWW0_9EURO|nr:D-amino-acid oxidase [Talaromyces proteolyticus]KAH8698607.1 D-amino-acid oxidase [Talaromyces proteolyticus]
MASQSFKITVIGAGVSGLTTALVLSQNPKYRITVVAKFMPGDYDAEYASPWAGANFWPMGAAGSTQAELEKSTWSELSKLAKEYPESGISFQKAFIHTRVEDVGRVGSLFCQSDKNLPWWSDLFHDFKSLDQSELTSGIHSTYEFTTVCINTAIYLPWLLSQCIKNGVIFKRAVVKHIADAASLHASQKPADLVVNCTGLMARNLGGVEDKTVVPARGQVVVVRNDPGIMATISNTSSKNDEMAYMMSRPGGGGTILGGCYQVGNWNAFPDPDLAESIKKGCLALYPELTQGKGVEELSVIRHGVGFRPLRPQGVRIETERVKGTLVVHNYGHGGWGYQSSYGSAAAVDLLVEREVKLNAKL